MKKTILAAVLAVALSSALLAQVGSGDSKNAEAKLCQPEKIVWKDGPPSLPSGAKMAVLEGDPSKEGMFVMRLRVPDRFHIPAHTHTKSERVTIIQGTFNLALGENPSRANAQPLPAGSYAVWPPAMTHEVWTEGETIIQLHGIGPWAINYVNPADDPRNAKK